MNKFFITVAIILGILASAIIYLGHKGEELLRTAAEDEAPATIGASLNIIDTRFSFFDKSAGISGLSIGQPKGFGEGNSFEIDDIDIKLSDWGLFQNHIRMEHVHLNNPKFFLVMKGKDSNFEALMNHLPPADDKANHTAKISIKDFQLNGLQLAISSDAVGTHDVTLADIQIANIGIEENGVPPEEARRIILEAVKPQITKALVELGLKSKVEGELEKQLDKQLGDKAGDVKDALKGLLKKKKPDDDGN